jgi:prepilin-type N-terminal cleavage/methylation domain-containing protein
MKIRVRAKGFTIVEMMVVVAIIAILSAIAIPAYKFYITTARQASARGNIEALRLAVENYRLDNLNTGTGYAPLNGAVWEPSGAQTLTTILGDWNPDGDQSAYNYAVTATATGYTITVTPIGYAADAQSFTK